jgi:hypothetical protein
MLCTALVVLWITTTMPDTGQRAIATEEQCVATNQEAKDLVALRAATMKPDPSEPPQRVEVKVYWVKPNGDRVHVYDLPATGKP